MKKLLIAVTVSLALLGSSFALAAPADKGKKAHGTAKKAMPAKSAKGTGWQKLEKAPGKGGAKKGGAKKGGAKKGGAKKGGAKKGGAKKGGAKGGAKKGGPKGGAKKGGPKKGGDKKGM
jgi:hypothetical protein